MDQIPSNECYSILYLSIENLIKFLTYLFTTFNRNLKIRKKDKQSFMRESSAKTHKYFPKTFIADQLYTVSKCITHN